MSLIVYIIFYLIFFENITYTVLKQVFVVKRDRTATVHSTKQWQRTKQQLWPLSRLAAQRFRLSTFKLKQIRTS